MDFETADSGSDSACAVGLVHVAGGKIVRRERHLIRPPRKLFLFTYIHGIAWEQVADKPSFAELWPTLKESLEEAEFFAAHNASFDRRVLEACCAVAGFAPPRQKFLCTVQLARKTWGLYPTKLPDVCRFLSIPLNHHEALSDAEACARIVLAAQKAGTPTPLTP